MSADHERQPVGALLDGLGIKVALGEGELVASAIVLVKVLQPDDMTRLALAYSEGLGWIERAGMLHVALAVDTAETTNATTD